MTRLASVLLLVGLLGGAARAETTGDPGTVGVGHLAPQPGMILRLMRPTKHGAIEVGRMRVLAVRGDELQLELLSGTSQMQNGDALELAQSTPAP